VLYVSSDTLYCSNLVRIFYKKFPIYIKINIYIANFYVSLCIYGLGEDIYSDIDFNVILYSLFKYMFSRTIVLCYKCSEVMFVQRGPWY
jgi:hypothetical protein